MARSAVLILAPAAARVEPVKNITTPVNGSRKGPVHWHVEIAGRRSGPHEWSVILELARSGALTADNLLWCPEVAAWKAAGEFPELLSALSRAKPRQPDAGSQLQAPDPPSRGALAMGLGWASLALGAV